MEENVKQQAFREALDVNRDIYNQSVAGIDADIERLKEQRKMIEQDYQTRKKAIIREFNQPTPESWAKRQRADAFQLQRIFGGIFNGFKTGTLDTENVQVSFDMQDDRKQVQFTITVPYRDFVPDENQG